MNWILARQQKLRSTLENKVPLKSNLEKSFNILSYSPGHSNTLKIRQFSESSILALKA